MIKFLFKGLIRDKHRSVLPITVVALGVMLTVFFYTWLTGVMGDAIEFNAKYEAGHVKIMSRAYSENVDQIPNDLALMKVDQLKKELADEYTDVKWAERIKFGGLADVPNEKGETRTQGPVIGFGIDLLSGDKAEIERMNISKNLRQGRLPNAISEVLLSDEFAKKLEIKMGDRLTLIGATMYGEMAIHNFIVVGTVHFGAAAMDRGSMIADIQDVRIALNMEDAVGEILGFFNDGYYDIVKADKLAEQFNTKFSKTTDEFSPLMVPLRQQSNMGKMVEMSDSMAGIIVFAFILLMSIVLWNAGLLGGLRRYGEFGVRLAIGEDKGHLYRSMVLESLLIGVMGSVIGTACGLAIAWYLQVYGIDFSSAMKNTSMLMPTVYRARITADAYFLGFVPGLISTVFGAMLAGLGIYKRKTASLFKELEA